MMATLLLLLCLVVLPAYCIDPGQVKFMMYDDSTFADYGSNSQYNQFMKDHYYRMQVYSPYFDLHTTSYPNGLVYVDAGGIDSKTDTNPSWILRDASGNKLFLNIGCDGKTCTKYAADIGNTAYRSSWAANVSAVAALGYKGLWVDNVSLNITTCDAKGTLVLPVDPRKSNTTMTLANFQKYFAEFMELVRQTVPTKYEIAHNAIWSLPSSSYITRQVNASTYQIYVNGFVDDKLVAGTGAGSASAFAAQIDAVHDMGKRVILQSYASSTQSAVYEIAWYLLTSEGQDIVGTSYVNYPDNWWSSLYDADLGSAVADRMTLSTGIIQRNFQNGTVFVAPPGVSGPITFSAIYVNLQDNSLVTSATTITLNEKQGLVLQNYVGSGSITKTVFQVVVVLGVSGTLSQFNYLSFQQAVAGYYGIDLSEVQVSVGLRKREIELFYNFQVAVTLQLDLEDPIANETYIEEVFRSALKEPSSSISSQIASFGAQAEIVNLVYGEVQVTQSLVTTGGGSGFVFNTTTPTTDSSSSSSQTSESAANKKSTDKDSGGIPTMTAIIICACVGGAAIVAGAIVIFVVVRKKKQASGDWL